MVDINNHNNGEYKTSETPLAIFLIQSGFTLLRIEYETNPHNRDIGNFIFDSTDSTIQERINSFHRCEALVNAATYENIRANLLNRIKRGLP
jgi:hypothetical protein